MKSIRLSLIVYFLVLLTGSLGAISWFSYQTTAQSLRQREGDACTLINTQCENQIKTETDDLDRRLLQKAKALANLRLVTAVVDPVMKGVFGFAQPANPRFGRDTFSYIDRAEALIVAADDDHPQEYFQIYRSVGKNTMRPLQRSESMGNVSFAFDETLQKELLKTERFDNVELKPGVMVRRVSLFAPVRSVVVPWRRGGGPGFGGGPPAGGGPPPGGGKGPDPKVIQSPAIIVQYAIELGPVEAKIASYQRTRDEQLAELSKTIEGDLRELRSRMLSIALATLVALWLGGFLVIRLGLAPLAKMSEAVSQVSSTNFELPLEPATLPQELRPIAERLTVTLQDLRKAFAREKQAAADISHELRTPLAALMTTLEVALRKSRSPQEYREILEECRASGQHMYQLVERLLTLARLDAGADQYRPVEADVTELALSSSDLIRPLARARGLELRLHLDEPIVTLTDPNKLREVLTNLLHNAVEYNKPSGAIDLTVTRVNGSARFEVRDTGVGIKPDALEHIFERFYRADPSRHADTPHAGLGLSIVKSYVDLMGGTIRVESSEAGTAFTVEIPVIVPKPNLETAIQTEPALVP